MVRRGQEIFCGCGRFRFVVRVIYGTAVKDAFAASRGEQQLEMFFDDVRDVRE